MFSIHASPTAIEISHLKSYYKELQERGLEHDFVITYAVDMETFQSVSTKPNPDISKLPANTRCPHDFKGGFMLGGKPVYNMETFKEAQKYVSTAVADMINFADENSIDFRFVNIKRSLRYIHVQCVDGELTSLSNEDERGGRCQGTHAGSDPEMSMFVINELLLPAFGYDASLLIQELLKASAYGATFVADVLACLVESCLTEDSPAWESVKKLDCKVCMDGTFSRDVFGQGTIDGGLARVNAKFEPCEFGTFHSLNAEKLPPIFWKNALKKAIQSVQAERCVGSIWNRLGFGKLWNRIRGPVFKEYVGVKDPLLNDIDDPVAEMVAESQSERFTSLCTWRRIQ